MKIQIKTVFDKLLYESDSETIKEAVVKAVNDEIDLRDADLSGADLRGADLRGADGEKIIIEKVPIQILTDTYDIIIFDAHMQIGCEFHLLSDWWGFSNKRISEMDGTKARRFWELWKAQLKEICKANGRGE